MPINFRKDENHISLTAEAGYAIRSLRGSGENAKAMIERALGNPQTTYYGPEFMVTIQVRQVSAFWVSNVMNAKDKSKVDGLTGYQQRFGFSIDAPLITI